MDLRLVVGAFLTWTAGALTLPLHGFWLAVHGVAVVSALFLFAVWVHRPGEPRKGRSIRFIRRRAAGRM